jgi:hypothetical protein
MGDSMELPKALSVIEENIRSRFVCTDMDAVVALLSAYKDSLEEIRQLKEALVEEKMTFVRNGKLSARLKELAEELDKLDHCASRHGVDGDVKEKLSDIVILAQRGTLL